MVKKHFKLYKSGKQWVSTAIVALASLTLGMTMVAADAQADTINQDANVSTTQVVDQPVTTEMKTAATVNTNANTEEQQPTQSGLVQRNGSTYYYNKDTNNYVTNSWENVNNNWYHFGDNGAASTGWYQSDANNWYMFNNDGSAKTGWYKSDAGNWYYFDHDNAWADTGWQKINNNWYHFDENNAWANKGWYQSGAGNWYYFDENNAWANTGWQKINNNWYHFDEDNAWADTGWQKINNTWYYFDTQNAWMLTGTHNIDGKSYNFNSNGAWIDDHSAAIYRAMSMRGRAYVWGGNNPSTGFDCSGLVQWAYGLGSQYRTTYQQQTLGVHHHDVANAPKGSLLFFGSDSAPYHVAISLGNGAYVHAPEPGDVIKVGYTKYYNASYYVTL